MLLNKEAKTKSYSYFLIYLESAPLYLFLMFSISSNFTLEKNFYVRKQEKESEFGG